MIRELVFAFIAHGHGAQRTGIFAHLRVFLWLVRSQVFTYVGASCARIFERRSTSRQGARVTRRAWRKRAGMLVQSSHQRTLWRKWLALSVCLRRVVPQFVTHVHTHVHTYTPTHTHMSTHAHTYPHTCPDPLTCAVISAEMCLQKATLEARRTRGWGRTLWPTVSIRDWSVSCRAKLASGFRHTHTLCGATSRSRQQGHDPELHASAWVERSCCVMCVVFS